MAVHDRAELDREGRRVSRATSASLMSDTKWRKVFAAIEARPELELGQCIFKFVETAQERVGNPGAGLYLPRPWVDTNSFGPIPLRSIEWILFPRFAEYRFDRTTPARHVQQNIDDAMHILSSLGQMPVEMTERGLFVRGYLPLDDTRPRHDAF